jgi:hypothetical protein
LEAAREVFEGVMLPLTEEAYARLYQHPAVQIAMAQLVGLPGTCAEQAYRRTRGISDKCLCPLPGHDDKNHKPSADVVFHRKLKVLKTRCHHGTSKPLGLPDLHAMRRSGVYRNLSPSELKIETIQMWVELGFVEPVEVARRSLPEDLPDDAPTRLREVAHAIVDLLSLRYVFGRHPAPLTHKFISARYGISERAVRESIQWLLKHWYLEGGVFLRKDGTFSKARETEMSPECFVMRLSVPKRHKSGDGVKRTRREWAIFRQEQRDEEALYWQGLEEAEASGELAEAVAEYEAEKARELGAEDLEELYRAMAEYEYEKAWRRGDFDDYWNPDEDQNRDYDHYDEPEPDNDEPVDGAIDEEPEGEGVS